MSGIAVVTDTTQYLPREVVERHGLEPRLALRQLGRAHRPRDRPGRLRRVLRLPARERGELPSTSQPSVGDFLAVYEPLLERGDDILSIHLSGGISGTVRAAEQARDALIERGVAPERIVVLDSRTGCAGHGLMAVAAANAAEGGADLAGARRGRAGAARAT